MISKHITKDLMSIRTLHKKYDFSKLFLPLSNPPPPKKKNIYIYKHTKYATDFLGCERVRFIVKRHMQRYFSYIMWRHIDVQAD